MATIKAPAKKRKGPPPSEETTNANLTKKSDTDEVAMNFKVSAEFRKKMKQYAAELSIPMVELLEKAVEEYMERH
jgi:hypothetical protein